MKKLNKFQTLNTSFLFLNNGLEGATAKEIAATEQQLEQVFNSTEQIRAHSELGERMGQERIAFAGETLDAERSHYEAAGKITPEDSAEIETSLQSEIDSINKSENEQVGLLNKKNNTAFDQFIVGPLDQIAGIQAVGFNSEEKAGSAEAAIDMTNPNLHNTFLRQGDVSERNSTMSA